MSDNKKRKVSAKASATVIDDANKLRCVLFVLSSSERVALVYGLAGNETSKQIVKRFEKSKKRCGGAEAFAVALLKWVAGDDFEEINDDDDDHNSKELIARRKASYFFACEVSENDLINGKWVCEEVSGLFSITDKLFETIHCVELGDDCSI